MQKETQLCKKARFHSFFFALAIKRIQILVIIIVHRQILITHDFANAHTALHFHFFHLFVNELFHPQGVADVLQLEFGQGFVRRVDNDSSHAKQALSKGTG